MPLSLYVNPFRAAPRFWEEIAWDYIIRTYYVEFSGRERQHLQRNIPALLIVYRFVETRGKPVVDCFITDQLRFADLESV